MVHRERVPGVVHSLAFSGDGRRLWCAHRETIAVRAWPSLELLGMHQLATTHLQATVNGTFLCATARGVLELDDDGRDIRSVPVRDAMALGFDEHGAMVVLRPGLVVERWTGEAAQPLGAMGAVHGVWWCALLPRTMALVLAVDDAPPQHVDVRTRVHRRDWDWLPQWSERSCAPGGAYRSWLSVDVAVDERCLVASDKGQNSTVIWLDERGTVTGYVGLERPTAPASPGWKGPSRGAAAAVHPHDDVVALIDISGRLRRSDARTGALLECVGGLFTGGYRWEG